MTAFPACADSKAGFLRQVVDEYDALAARRPWPGFDAGSVPLALYDRERTYLLRHPAPPEEFERLRGGDGVLVLDSVHPAMRGNLVARVGGAATAAVLADTGRGADAPAVARTLLHEAFHVHQEERHPGWTANEVDLFTYPVSRVRLLALRRLETGALRRALMAPDSVRELCWAQAFLRLRDERFGLLPPEAAAYERGTELREGLARYVAAHAADQPPPAFSAEGFAPDRVRDRGYAIGHALAVLLDRLDRGWKDAVAAGEVATLDAALDRAVGSMRVRHCGPSPDEARRALAVARADSATLARRNERDRIGFEEAPGWRIVLELEREPWFPEAFDPLNVRVLGEGFVLHDRWIRLVGEGGSAEVLDRRALTLAAGGHPLFDGVRRLSIAGLRSEPTLRTAGDSTRIEAEGVRVVVSGASVSREGQTTRIAAGG